MLNLFLSNFPSTTSHHSIGEYDEDSSSESTAPSSSDSNSEGRRENWYQRKRYEKKNPIKETGQIDKKKKRWSAAPMRR